MELIEPFFLINRAPVSLQCLIFQILGQPWNYLSSQNKTPNPRNKKWRRTIEEIQPSPLQRKRKPTIKLRERRKSRISSNKIVNIQWRNLKKLRTQKQKILTLLSTLGLLNNGWSWSSCVRLKFKEPKELAGLTVWLKLSFEYPLGCRWTWLFRTSSLLLETGELSKKFCLFEFIGELGGEKPPMEVCDRVSIPLWCEFDMWLWNCDWFGFISRSLLFKSL